METPSVKQFADTAKTAVLAAGGFGVSKAGVALSDKAPFDVPFKKTIVAGLLFGVSAIGHFNVKNKYVKDALLGAVIGSGSSIITTVNDELKSRVTSYPAPIYDTIKNTLGAPEMPALPMPSFDSPAKNLKLGYTTDEPAGKTVNVQFG